MDISGQQYMLAPLLDENEQFQDVGVGDAVFVLDPRAAQDIGDLGDNGLGNDGGELALAKGSEDCCREACGFRTEETQMLVSRTALIATFLFPDFLNRAGDIGLSLCGSVL